MISSHKPKSPFMFYLLKADFFSENISLNFNQAKKINTVSGMLLTMVVIICSVVLALIFGKEVYNRTNPSVSQSNYFVSDSIVKGENLLFFFNVRNFGGTMFANPFDYFDLNAYTLKGRDAVVYESYYYDLNITKCNEQHFEKYKEKLSINNIDYISYINFYYCINLFDGFEIYNPYGYANTTLNRFNFMACDLTHGAENCPADLNDKMKEFYFDFKFLDSYIDSSDYNNPIKYYFNSLFIQVSNLQQKRTYLSFINMKFTNDKGWLFEDSTTNEFVIFSKNDVETFPLSGYTNNFYIITLQSPLITSKYSRSYLKIQDVFAKVGGFINGLVIVIKILTIDFFEYSYLTTINDLIITEKSKTQRKSSQANLLSEIPTRNKSNYLSNNPIEAKREFEGNKKLSNNNNNLIVNNIRTSNNINCEKEKFNNSKSVFIEQRDSTNKLAFHKNSVNTKNLERKKKPKLSNFTVFEKQTTNENNLYANTINQIRTSNPQFNNYINKNLNNNNTNYNNEDKKDNYDNNMNSRKYTNEFEKDRIISPNFSNNSFNYSDIDLNSYKITNSFWSYIKYRIVYLLCCYDKKRKNIINKIKEYTFDFLSLENEIKNKIPLSNLK